MDAVPAPCWSREVSGGDRDRGRAPPSSVVAPCGRHGAASAASLLFRGQAPRPCPGFAALCPLALQGPPGPPRAPPLRGFGFPTSTLPHPSVFAGSCGGASRGLWPCGRAPTQSQPLLPRGGGLGPLLCCGDAGVMRAFALWPLPSGWRLLCVEELVSALLRLKPPSPAVPAAGPVPGSSPRRPASWREVVLALRLPLWGRWAGHTPRGTRTRSSSSQVTFYAQKLFSWCSVFVSKRRVRPCGERSCLGAGPPGGGRPAWLCCSPRWARRVGPQRPCASRGPPGPPWGCAPPSMLQPRLSEGWLLSGDAPSLGCGFSLGKVNSLPRASVLMYAGPLALRCLPFVPKRGGFLGPCVHVCVCSECCVRVLASGCSQRGQGGCGAVGAAGLCPGGEEVGVHSCQAWLWGKVSG